MSTVIAVAALCVALAAVIGLGVAVWWDQLSKSRPDWIVRRQVRSTFVVELNSGVTWQGVLIAADRRSLMLANPLNVTELDRAPIAAEGHVILDRTQVAHMQVAVTRARPPAAYVVTAEGFTEARG